MPKFDFGEKGKDVVDVDVKAKKPDVDIDVAGKNIDGKAKKPDVDGEAKEKQPDVNVDIDGKVTAKIKKPDVDTSDVMLMVKQRNLILMEKEKYINIPLLALTLVKERNQMSILVLDVCLKC